MNEISLKTKLTWQCRRGMLELDVILQPFLQDHFDGMSREEQLIFSELLQEADPDLYSWLMGYVECTNQRLASVIETIRGTMGINA